MSETFHELCCFLVGEFYGAFHKRLFSTLTHHGRLSAQQIAQISHIPLQKVKAGLSVLVHCRLAHHNTTPDGSTTYHAHTDTAYNLLRVGRLVSLARDSLGDIAAAALSEIIPLGFASTAELEIRTIEAVARPNSKPTYDDNENGHTISKLHGDAHLAVEKLLEHGFLTYVRTAHFQSTFDTKKDVERILKTPQSGQAQRSKKAALEMETQIENTLQKRLSTRTSESGYVPDALVNNKRTLDEPEDRSYSKKQKLNGGAFIKINGNASFSIILSQLNQAAVVSANFSPLITNIRNKSLHRRAKKILGARCGEVLVEAISQVPSAEPWCLHPAFSTIDISSIRDGINRHSQLAEPNGYQYNGILKVNGARPHHEDELSHERVSYNEVDRDLALLKEGEFIFLQGSLNQEWHIEKCSMDEFARNHEILRMMGDRLQPPALRIIRMLIDKGKLDEKTLQELGLLGAKELRQTLGQLKQMGYIDLQEVPRESQRQPNRTIFLWFYDSDRVRRVLLESIYKAMARLMQRMNMERNKVSSTLEKIERSDVQGHEEQIMSAAELRVLKRWQRLEQWLLGELERLDDSVVLMRDL